MIRLMSNAVQLDAARTQAAATADELI